MYGFAFMVVAFSCCCLYGVANGLQFDRSKVYDSLKGVDLNNAVVTAGVSKINATLPIGTPLAGYNHGARRHKYWPLPDPGEYTTWMVGAKGNLEPTWVKAVVLTINNVKMAFVTLDGIGSDGTLNQIAYSMAKASGQFSVPFENCLFSSSHTHSGPGAVASEFLWSIAPATDLVVPKLQLQLASSMATAMVEAEGNQKPAKIDIGSGMLTGVTQNRRAKESPYVNKGSIDPHLGLIRIDDASGGQPIATIWNYAIHGTCFGPDNLFFSGDIMGGVCSYVESKLNGAVTLFINADAGDIDPTSETCAGMPNFAGAPKIGEAILKLRESLVPTNDVQVKAYTHVVEFGPTDLNATLGRFDNCTTGGPLDVCSLCRVLNCDLNVHLGSSWIENAPRFLGFSFVIHSKKHVLVSAPGEPLVELGWWIRNDTAALGFDTTILAGYSNSHMGYFATPDEYDVGGYESQLTFWGIDTAVRIRQGCKTAATAVVP